MRRHLANWNAVPVRAHFLVLPVDQDVNGSAVRRNAYTVNGDRDRLAWQVVHFGELRVRSQHEVVEESHPLVAGLRDSEPDPDIAG